MTQSKTIQLAIDKQIDRQRGVIDHARGLRQLRILVKMKEDGQVEEVLVSPDTSSEWGDNHDPI